MERVKAFIKQYSYLWPYAAFLGIALVIIGPGLAPGYLFLLDMPWPESFQLSDFSRSGLEPQFLVFASLSVLNVLIPAWILQKLVLVIVLTGACMSVYTLSRFVLNSSLVKRERISESTTTYMAFWSGLLAVMNPFVFERLAAGQWLVIAGYAYVPFVIYTYLKHGPGWRFWITYALLPVVSIHFWGMFTILSLIVLGIFNRSALKNIMKSVELYATFLIVNSYWIASLIRGSNQNANNLGRGDFEAFQTIGDQSVGILGNVLSLHGFWRPQSVIIKEENALWFAYALIIFSLAMYGLYIALRSKKLNRFAHVSLLSFVLALIFAIGYGHPVTRTIVEPFTHVPLAASLRETAKAVGLIGLLYAFWTPYGLMKLSERFRFKTQSLTVYAAVTKLIMMSSMLFGLRGTLATYDYPAGWRTVNTTIDDKSSALILPWQGYMEIQFANNAFTANPAQLYFDFDTIQSQYAGNSLLDEGEENITNVLDAYVRGELSFQGFAETIANQQGVDHIVLLKTGNWTRYIKIIDDAQQNILFEDDSIVAIKIR